MEARNSNKLKLKVKVAPAPWGSIGVEWLVPRNLHRILFWYSLTRGLAMHRQL